jgi:outer membrane protein TolC
MPPTALVVMPILRRSIFALALMLVGLRAQESPPAGVVDPGGPVLELSLEEAMGLSIRNNLALRSSLLDEEIERRRIEEALGVFDPTFFADVRTGRREVLFASNFPRDPADPTSPTVTRIISQTSDVAGASMGVRGVLETGLSYDLTFNTDYEFRSGSDGLNPIYTSTTSINFTQPLLREAWGSYLDAPVETARIRALESREAYRIAERDKLREVQDSYYDLVFALADLEVRQQSLALAEEQVALTRTRVETGALAEIEITSAEAAAAQRRAELVTAEAAALEAEDRLRRQLFTFDRDADWRVRIRPTEQVEESYRDPLPVEEITRLAERAHPELLQAHLMVARARVDVRQRESERKPRLDLTASATISSLSNTPDQAFRQSMSEDDGAASWEVGLQFEYPIGNRAALARLAQSELGLRKATLELQEARTEMIFRVRTALRNIQVAQRSIAARKVAERLAREQLENERLRLELKRSTNFQVFQVQDDLDQRRTDLIRAILDYRLALLELSRATGLSLDHLVVDPESGR